jgi:hypothetical protein
VADGRPEANIGDRFLLFSLFRYDFRTALPIWLEPSIQFAQTSQGILDNADPSQLAGFVLPGYRLPGTGVVHCCLRHPSDAPEPSWGAVSDLFFHSLTALRLHSPLPMAVEGEFELGERNLFTRIVLYHLHTLWQPVPEAWYSGPAIQAGARLLQRIRGLTALGNTKVFRGYTVFQQATCGYAKSLSMTVLALWSALEHLYQPAVNNRSGKYFKTLVERLEMLVGHLPDMPALIRWVGTEYQTSRQAIIQGLLRAVPDERSLGEGPDIQGAPPLGCLHELVRLSLLAFIDLPDEEIIAHNTLNKPKLTAWFEQLQPPSGASLTGQRPWLSAKVAEWLQSNKQSGLHLTMPAADALQPMLRSGFRAQLRRSVRPKFHRRGKEGCPG